VENHPYLIDHNFFVRVRIRMDLRSFESS